MQRFVVVDLDGTLTVDLPGVAYPDKPLHVAVGSAVSSAREAGFGVMVLTARGMRTYENDREQVERHVRPGVEAWLQKQRVPHDQVHVAKPWCGPGGFYVDDRNLHLEEFVFRFTGPFAGRPVAVHVEGLPPADPVAARERLLRIERWLDVCRWVGLPGPPARSDDREPDLTLTIELGRHVPNVAGWLALHGEDEGGALAVLPLEVVDRDARFRLARVAR